MEHRNEPVGTLACIARGLVAAVLLAVAVLAVAGPTQAATPAAPEGRDRAARLPVCTDQASLAQAVGTRIPRRRTCRPASLLELRRELGRRSRAVPRRYQGVQVPVNLRGPLVFPGARGAWQMLGVPNSRRVSFQRGVTYRVRGFEVVQAFGDSELKESIVVHRRQGVRTWRWRLLGAGPRPRIDRAGRVHFGRNVVLAAPFLTNRAGAKLPRKVRWRLRGNILELRVADRGLPLPYVIDPSADYPNILYPDGSASGVITGAEALRSGAEAWTPNQTTEIKGGPLGPTVFWSGYTRFQNPYTAPMVLDDFDPPFGVDGVPMRGQAGWVRPLPGATTLPANSAGGPGTWTVGASVCPDSVAPGMKAQIRARVLRVHLSGGTIDRWRTLAPWSTTGIETPSLNACRAITTTLTPTSRSLAPDEYLYLEIAGMVTSGADAGNGIHLQTGNASTYLDFGVGANFNTAPPVPTNLTINPTPNALDIVPDSTPTFAADLNDADSYHHLDMQVCNDAACTSLAQSASTAANSTWSGVNNWWTSPGLADGVYYYRARTVEDATPGQVLNPPSGWSATVRFVVDTTPPAPPATVRDGTGADVAYISSTTQLSANWPAVVDASGISRYDYCFSTDSAGSDCGGGAIVDWTSNGTSLTVTHTGLSLVDGTLYYSCVRARDNAGFMSLTIRCSNGQRLDTIAPAPPAPVDDGLGADVDYTNSGSILRANWATVTDPSAIDRYDYCMSTAVTANACSGTILQAWVSNAGSTSVSRSPLALVNGTIYYTCARARDLAGNQGTGACSDGQMVDTQAPPQTAAVRDGAAADIALTNDGTRLESNWDAVTDSTPGSGLARYDQCFTTSSTGADCGGAATVPWRSTGTTSSASSTGLTLTHAVRYYSCVRAVDNVANTATVRCSDGVVVDTMAPTADHHSFTPTQTAFSFWAGPKFVNDVLWFNPAAGAATNVDVLVQASDPSGIARVSFPDLSAFAGWSGGGDDLASETVGVDANLYRRTYTFNGPAAATPGVQNAVAYDAAGNPTNIPFELRPDPVPPVAGTIGGTAGLQNTAAYTWPVSGPADLESGLGNWVAYYDYSPLEDDGCNAFSGTWTVGTSGTGVLASITVTMSSSGCIMLRYAQYDAVGNLTMSNVSPVRRFDLDVPTVDIDTPATGALLSGTFPVGGDASDGESGIDTVVISYVGPDSGTVTCAAPGLTLTQLTPTTWTYSCPWDTSALDDGDYDVTAVSYDVAGNASAPFTITIRLDNQPPPVPTPINDGTAADIDWSNATNTLSANWTAVVDAGTGIDRYEYCISTSSSGADCAAGAFVPWTDNLLATNVTRADLALVEGTTYYTCAVAWDNAGNDSAPACSDGVTIDRTAPSDVFPNDGTSMVDYDWQSSLTTLDGGFLHTPPVDPLGGGVASGKAAYEFCFTTSATGATCLSAPGLLERWIRTASINPAGQGFGMAGLTLTEGETYYTCTAIIDNAGNRSTTRCSDGVTVDSVPPPAPATVDDGTGADIDFTSDATQLEANWAAVVDPAPASGVATYQYCFTTDATGANCGTAAATVQWTDEAGTSVTRTGLTLTHAVEYFACIRAVDVAGSNGALRCSDGNTVDIMPPPAPTPVNDGTAADVDWSNAPATLSGNWATVTDPSGINRYEYCISTSSTGADCAGAATVAWTDNLLATSTTEAGLTLVDGTTYFVCAAAFDNGLNSSPVACSDGITLDLVAPPATAEVRDGTGATDAGYAASTTTLSANWDTVVDPAPASGVDRYEYCFSTSATGADCAAGATATWTTRLTTSITRAGLLLANGTTYHACVRTFDRAGNVGATLCSDGQLVDSVAPAAPATVDDGTAADIDVTGDATQLEANWAGAVDPLPSSGIARYDYCFTTNNTGTGANCDLVASATLPVPWTANGAAATVTHTGLTLAHNSRYYACVRAVDNAGNVGAVRCSDGQTVDTMPPPAPAPVRDGAGADVDWSSSLDTITANWATVVDPSGINRYEYCITTVATGTDCAMGAFVTWTDNAVATSVADGGLALVDGATYYVCALAYDNGLNVGPAACSDGVTIDQVDPLAPPAVRDGTAADAAWTSSLTTLSANWDTSVDPAPASGTASYEYCFSTSATGADCAAGATATWTARTPTSVTRAGLTLTNGTTYHACVRAIDVAGNTGAQACSNGLTVDSTIPPAPATVDDGPGADIDFTSDATQLEANWAAVVDPAPASGVTGYQYCFTTNVAGTNCHLGTSASLPVPWTDEAGTSITRGGLTLAHGTRYYACVRAVDAAGNLGTVACSDGQTVDTMPPAAPTLINDGTAADVDFTGSVTQLSANWNAAADPSGITDYEYCFTTSPTGADCAAGAAVTWTSNGTVRTVTETGLTLLVPVEYYSCVRATDGGGNTGPAGCSDGQLTDDGPPPPPATVNDGNAADITWTGSLTTLRANWAASVDVSGINRYEYCISTSSSGADCGGGGALVDWTSTATATSFLRGGLALTSNTTYYACIQAFDGVGNVSATFTCSDGQTVDTTAPGAVNAIAPTDGSSPDEGPMTLDWSAAPDGQSGTTHYDVWVDGMWQATNVAADAWGPYDFYPGNHVWRIRAWDAVGNSSTWEFDFFAVDVPDVTPPDPFDLLTPAHNASLPSGSDVTWEAAYDWEGIASYNVFIDGALTATVPGTQTAFTVGAGSGAPLCGGAVVNYDPAINVAPCAYDATYPATWTIGAHGGFNAGGNAIGFSGYDGPSTTTALTYTVDVPATGGDLRFEHHYDNHATMDAGEVHSAWDGGHVQISTDNGATWLSTCAVGAKAEFGVSLQCQEEVMERDGGYTGVLTGPADNNTLADRHVFAGTSPGMVLSRLRLSKWSGTTIKVRFIQAQDSCHVGLSADMLEWCPAGVKDSDWHIDNITLAEPTLSLGGHSWFIQAVDPSGNKRNSNQTWNFTLTP